MSFTHKYRYNGPRRDIVYGSCSRESYTSDTKSIQNQLKIKVNPNENSEVVLENLMKECLVMIQRFNVQSIYHFRNLILCIKYFVQYNLHVQTKLKCVSVMCLRPGHNDFRGSARIF